MSKAGARMIAGMLEAGAIARGEQPAARMHIGGFAYVPEPKWRSVEDCPLDSSALVWFGDTIPDMPDMRSATRISGGSAAELGYGEYAGDGGWLIWNDGSDYYVLALNDAIGWMPMPLTPPRGAESATLAP